MPYVPGSSINGYCSKCRGDTMHVVIDAAGSQVRSVRCSTCGSKGSYKTPREKTKAAILAARKKSTPPPAPKKKSGRSRASKSPKDMLNRLLLNRDLETALEYGAGISLNPGDLVKHPTFGYGIVLAVTNEQKAKVLFSGGERLLVCNRT